ncbi:MAG: hypothetical protein WBD13_02235, partial [Burkholderiaceae bacterium]
PCDSINNVESEDNSLVLWDFPMPQFSTRLRSTPLFAGIVAATFTVLLSACGGSDSGPESTAPVNDARFENVGVSLTQSGVASDGAVTKAAGDNLINLNTAWPTWAGADSGITFDAQTGQLLIPGDGSDVVLGVRRFDTELSDGVSYTLNVQSTDPQSAAVLFLFDTNGTIVPVPGTDGLASARDGEAITFTAPAGVAGFYLQVQNQYQASVASLISAELIEGASIGGGGVVGGDNLIDAQGPWLDWAGNATGINGDGGNVTIPASANGTGLVHGIKRFSTSLTANTEYELAALTGSGPDAAVLLFLLDASGQIISFSGNAGSTPWLTAIHTNALRFRAPEGVASFVVQVQGPLNASGFTGVLPSLMALSDEVEPPTAGACNRIVNGDFEDGLNGWNFSGAQLSTEGYEGDGVTLSDGFLSYEFMANAGEALVFSGMYKGIKEGSNFIGVDFLDVDGKKVDGVNTELPFIQFRSPDLFSRFNRTATVPTDAVAARIWLYTNQDITVDNLDVRTPGCLAPMSDEDGLTRIATVCERTIDDRVVRDPVTFESMPNPGGSVRQEPAPSVTIDFNEDTGSTFVDGVKVARGFSDFGPNPQGGLFTAGISIAVDNYVPVPVDSFGLGLEQIDIDLSRQFSAYRLRLRPADPGAGGALGNRGTSTTLSCVANN